MRIAVLSRNTKLHSIRRLLEEARTAGIACDVINPLECHVLVDGKESGILRGGTRLPRFDAVLPRIGASITDYGLAVVRHFENLGVDAVNGSEGISRSRDKLRCLQALSKAGIQVPTTVMTRDRKHLEKTIQTLKRLPVVLKVLKGTQGVGVMLVHTQISLGSVLDTLRGLRQDVMIQEYIEEAGGRDLRAFVIGDRVVAAMLRTAPQGEFRANIHRGGAGKPVRLEKDFEKTAILATKVLGLEIAGVDLMESSRGPLVIEVNSSPGFQGIEKATGMNVAREIIQHVSARGKKPA